MVTSRRAFLAIGAVMVAAMAVAAAPAARSDTAAADASPISAPVGFDLSAFNNATSHADIHVPPGLVPTSIVGTFTPPTSTDGSAVHPGIVEVYAGERLLASLPAAPGPFHALLQPADVIDGILSIGLSYSVPDDHDNFCANDEQSITLSRILVAYAGTQTMPTTVATFLSPAVTAVSVVLPSASSERTIEAGLAAVGAITYRLGPDVLVLMSFDQPDPRVLGTSGSRIVAIKEGTNPPTTAISMAGGVPVLTIVGSGADLTAATSALGSSLLPLASSAVTTGLSLTGLPGSTSTTLSLADLGNPRPTLSGWGSQAFFIGVRQSAFGGPVQDVTVHLVGTHSAMPSDVAASVNVYWNGFLIGSEVLGAMVPLDLVAAVPNSVLAPANGLRVVFTAIPASGHCAGDMRRLPMELHIDGTASTVAAGRGQALGPGFQRFPQALSGALPIALGSGLGLTSAALDASLITASLQVASAGQLAVSVVSVDELARQSMPGLLVGASAEEANTLEAPLRLAEFRTIAPSVVSFGVGVSEPFAVLEAFTQGGRDLLMLGTWSPNREQEPRADAAAREVASHTYLAPGGWSSLGGDLLLGDQVVGAAVAELVPLDSNAIAPQPAVTQSYQPVAWWILAAFLVLLGIGLLRMFSIRRSRRRLRAYVDAQEQADRDAGVASTDGWTDPPVDR